MEIKIKFHTDNAAFTEDPYEIQDVLNKSFKKILESSITDEDDGDWIYDSNGNKIGYWELSQE